MEKLKKGLFSIPYALCSILMLVLGIVFLSGLLVNSNSKSDFILSYIMIIMLIIIFIVIILEMIYVMLKLFKSKKLDYKKRIMWVLITYLLSIFIIPYSYFIVLNNEKKYKKICILYIVFSIISYAIFFAGLLVFNNNLLA